MHGGASPPVKLTPADAARPRFLSPNRVGAEIPQFAVLRDATPALEEDARGRALSGKVGLGRCSTAAFPFVKSRWNVNSPVYRLARCDSCSGRGCTGAHPHPAKFPRPAQYGRASFRQIALERKFHGLPSCAMRFQRWKRMHGAPPPAKLAPAGAARPRFFSPNCVGMEIPRGYYPAFPKTCEKKSRAKVWGRNCRNAVKKFAIIGDMPSKRRFPWQKANFARNRSPFADGASPKAVLLLF